jgi:hypothetical protein
MAKKVLQHWTCEYTKVKQPIIHRQFNNYWAYTIKLFGIIYTFLVRLLGKSGTHCGACYVTTYVTAYYGPLHYNLQLVQKKFYSADI